LLWDFSLDMLVTRSASKSMARPRSYMRGQSESEQRPQQQQSSAPLISEAAPASPALCMPTLFTNGSSTDGGTESYDTALSGPMAPATSNERRLGKLARLRGHASGSSSTKEEPELLHISAAIPGPVVGALGRFHVPIIEPVMSHVAHIEPLTDVYFLDSGVVTADCRGNVKIWVRPPQEFVPPLYLPRAGGSSSIAGRHRPGDLD
jgi:hypothetical protein